MSELPVIPGTTLPALLDEPEDSTASMIKDLAAELVPDAMKTLKKLNRGGKKVPATVQRAAANDILTQAAGRPEARRVAVDAGGLKINIIQLFGEPSKAVMRDSHPITKDETIEAFSEPVD